MQVCDAGGGRQERRQWIELVRENRVGCLVFVADSRDFSEDTRSLFKQLANAKWAQRATVIVALTKLDMLLEERGDAGARQACAQHEAEFRAECQHPFSTHVLDARDQTAAARLIVEAVGSASPGFEEHM